MSYFYLPQTATWFIDKCFFIRADVLMSDTCQYSDLVECIFLFFV